MSSIITSITNLQNLPNLISFEAQDNALQTIDLSEMTSLKAVDVSDNDNLDSTGLKSINLSGCTSLEELLLDDNDFSGGFPDLSGLNNLKIIDFDECKLVDSVDISNLPALQRFDFSGNTQLTELIISSSQPIGEDGDCKVSDCDLTQTSVDNILIELSGSAVMSGYIELDGGTNSPPSEIGLEAIDFLTAGFPGKSWNIFVNSI
jgi:Leucine-rich repeat (LRR) protein